MYDKRDDDFMIWNRDTNTSDHYKDGRYTHTTHDGACGLCTIIFLIALGFVAWFLFS